MKKGGILGIVQHRGNEDMDKDFKNGYVKESFDKFYRRNWV